MNKRISYKLRLNNQYGRINSIFYKAPAKNITNRLWAVIKLLKKLHQINDKSNMTNKMTLFADSVFNKHTTKRDVYKYVKIIKSHYHPIAITYKPKYISDNHQTWTDLHFNDKDNHFITRWMKSLNDAEVCVLNALAVGSTFKLFQLFLKRVKHNFIKHAR